MSVSARRMRLGWGGLATCAAVALVAASFGNGWLVVPDRWNPWAPLWPQEPPSWLTPYKLTRLADDPAACAAALAATRLSYSAVPDRTLAGGCGWSDAVRVTALPARVGTPFVLTCASAVALAMWERHSVQPEARARFGVPVVAVEHYGSFACRDIGGGRTDDGDGRRSEHATANAFDVAAFVLADGSTVSVARDWPRDGTDRRAQFLRAVRDGACRDFSVVLGPDYNAAHRDHFHLDRGRFGACR